MLLQRFFIIFILLSLTGCYEDQFKNTSFEKKGYPKLQPVKKPDKILMPNDAIEIKKPLEKEREEGENINKIVQQQAEDQIKQQNALEEENFNVNPIISNN